MAIIKKPFIPYELDQERTKPKRDIFSVQVNPAQRAWLNEFKKHAKIKSDSVAIKLLAKIGINAIINIFGVEHIRYLASEDRIKLLQE